MEEVMRKHYKRGPKEWEKKDAGRKYLLKKKIHLTKFLSF